MHTNINSDLPRRLSISEMAGIHKISRQTLIYYDKIGLFKPDIVEDNGYRYYSPTQIPKLREICFLRSIDMPLDEIRKHNEYNSSVSSIELLEAQKEKINTQINHLKDQKKEIEKRLKLYGQSKNVDFNPYIQFYPERKICFHEWDKTKPSRAELHNALTKAWRIAESYNILPTRLYGTLFNKESVLKNKPLEKISSCFILDEDINVDSLPNVTTLRAGEYVCVQKFEMSYDTKMLKKVLKWIDENGFELAGDIYDESLLDGGIYEDKSELDFTELQVPIKKKRKAK